jgi:hypothetical protein
MVRYVAVQFADQAHPAKVAAGAHPPGSTVIVACTVIVVATISLSLTPSSHDGLHRREQRVVILNLSLALTTPTALEGCFIAIVPPCPRPPLLPSLRDTLLAFHCSMIVTVTNTSMLRNALAAPTPHWAAAAPAKPLDNLLYLPPEAVPVQEAIGLVEDKPLQAAVTLEQ